MIYIRGVGCHEPRLTNSPLRNEPDVCSESDSHEDTHFSKHNEARQKYERREDDGGKGSQSSLCARPEDRFDLENIPLLN